MKNVKAILLTVSLTVNVLLVSVGFNFKSSEDKTESNIQEEQDSKYFEY